jgi:hypothetical protein
MPSVYLQPGEYAAYGAPSNTTAGQVSQASVLIDAHLKRLEGLVWSPDSAGNPAWMTALTPRLSLTAPGAIAPGSNVVVPVTGGIQSIAIGDALILDRSNNGASEVVVVGGMTTSPATVTLVSVVNAHSVGALLDQGMVLKQHLFMPQDRPVKNLAYTPVVRLLSGQGRYAYGRRGDSSRYMVDEFNLLASLTAFGGPPAWEFFPLQNTGIDPETGQIWVPAGVMLAYYSEVNIWYVAGFAQANIPDAVKFACAQLITAAAGYPELQGNVKSFRAGDTQIQKFSASLLSDDSKRQLDPFRAKLFV